MTGSEFESLCKGYGIEFIYSKSLQIFLLMSRSLDYKQKSTLFPLEKLEEFTDHQIEELVARLALTHLMAEPHQSSR